MRLAALFAEVEALEHRRSALRAEVEPLAGPIDDPTRGRLDVHLRRLLERLRRWSASLRAPDCSPGPVRSTVSPNRRLLGCPGLTGERPAAHRSSDRPAARPRT